VTSRPSWSRQTASGRPHRWGSWHWGTRPVWAVVVENGRKSQRTHARRRETERERKREGREKGGKEGIVRGGAQSEYGTDVNSSSGTAGGGEGEGEGMEGEEMGGVVVHSSTAACSRQGRGDWKRQRGDGERREGKGEARGGGREYEEGQSSSSTAPSNHSISQPASQPHRWLEMKYYNY
jgi:hypothetical protein